MKLVCEYCEKSDSELVENSYSYDFEDRVKKMKEHHLICEKAPQWKHPDFSYEENNCEGVFETFELKGSKNKSELYLTIRDKKSKCPSFSIPWAQLKAECYRNNWFWR